MIRSETGFANFIALLALTVSLASAGWSLFAFAQSSEITPLPIDEINVFSEAGVPQIKLEVSIANLAYGDYDDVAREQEVILKSGAHRLRFVAARQATLNLLPRRGNTYQAPVFPCYRGGVGLAVCPTTDTPVVALPAGEVITETPLFELAETDCGLADCKSLDMATLAGMMLGPLTVTYSVHTMRDGVRSTSCTLTVTPDDVHYLVDVAGWFNPRCEGERT